jgi:hypothetical protein
MKFNGKYTTSTSFPSTEFLTNINNIIMQVDFLQVDSIINPVVTVIF